MQDAMVGGLKGKFFTEKEFERLCAKITANNQLIKELQKEVGIDEQTIQTDN